jgi:hypothetical protein
MKTHLIIPAAILLVQSLHCNGAEQGHVYPIYTTNTFAVDQMSQAKPGQASIDYTGFVFRSVSGSNYTFAGSFLDEGVSLFRASENELFTQSALDSGLFQRIDYGSSFDFSDSFYLCLRTPASGVAWSSYTPAYGWIKMSSSNGVLSVLDSGIDYSGHGVQVGSLAVVPEPATTAVLLGAASFSAVLLLRKRRSRIQK